MSKAVKKTVLFFFVLFLAPLCYGAAQNRLLDIGVLQKKDGKALVFIFENPAEQKDRRIRFNGNRLNVTFYGFVSELKKVPQVQKDIPAIKDIAVTNEAEKVSISLIFKDEVKDLLSNQQLTFLTNDPYMLGIVFTQDYLNRFQDSSPNEQKSEKESPQKEDKNQDVELPFVKYEDIFALPTATEKKVRDSSKQKDLKKDLKDKKVEHVESSKPLAKKPITPKRSIPKGEEHLALLKLVASLSAVLGIVIISLFLWKKLLFFKYKGNSQLIKILGVHHFGTRQSIAVVQVGEEKFLLGITSDSIQLITKLESKGGQEEDVHDQNPGNRNAVDILREKFSQLKRV